MPHRTRGLAVRLARAGIGLVAPVAGLEALATLGPSAWLALLATTAAGLGSLASLVLLATTAAGLGSLASLALLATTAAGPGLVAAPFIALAPGSIAGLGSTASLATLAALAWLGWTGSSGALAGLGSLVSGAGVVSCASIQWPILGHRSRLAVRSTTIPTWPPWMTISVASALATWCVIALVVARGAMASRDAATFSTGQVMLPRRTGRPSMSSMFLISRFSW